MTADEACQHEWIREGMVHRSRNVGRSKRHSDLNDPYRTAATLKIKGEKIFYPINLSFFSNKT